MNYSENFLTFWDTYPRRKGDSKSKTYEKWSKLKLDDNIVEILQAVKKYREYKEVKQGFNKGALVWLNQRMWESINEEEVPVLSQINKVHGSNEEELRVINNVINPLIDFYGDPDWYSNGRNSDRIMLKWIGLLKNFSNTSIKKGLDDLIINRPYQNFPALSDVYKYIDKYSYLSDNKSSNIRQEAYDWYNNNFIDVDDNSNICMSARRKALWEMLDILEKREDCSNYSFAKMVERLWDLSIIQNEYKRLEEMYTNIIIEKSKTSKTREWLKRIFIKYREKKNNYII